MNLNREQIVKFVLLKRPVKSAVTTINNQELHDLCTDLLSAMDALEKIKKGKTDDDWVMPSGEMMKIAREVLG